MKEKIQSWRKDIVAYFQHAEKEDLINQDMGHYNVTTPIDTHNKMRFPSQRCCVGAHLAESYYTKGVHCLVEYLRDKGFKGITAVHLGIMFRRCGLYVDPWGSDEWNILPSEVFGKMLKIEKVPELNGDCLTYSDFDCCDLKDLQAPNCSFIQCSFKQANLSGANLEGADLNASSCMGTNFKNANLRQADLRGAQFSRADLRGADLRGADLTGSSIDKDGKGAKFDKDQVREIKEQSKCNPLFKKCGDHFVLTKNLL